MLVDRCPGCRSSNFAILKKTGEPIYLSVGERTFCQPEYQINHCLNCGLYYKNNVINESELAQYYPQANFLRYEYEELFPTERITLEALLKLPKGSKILDFGCSTGRLLSRLVGDYECLGMEVNVTAKMIAESKGIKIIDWVDLSNSNELKFDAILLSDVFEHLSHPTDLLTKLCQSLNTDGLLLICTGNADVPACQKEVANFWYFRSIEHLCMLSRKHAHFLSNHLNLQLISWREISHYDFGIYDLVRQYIQDFAYWQFHGENKLSFKSILRFIPVLNKAEKWHAPPAFSCSKDHVLVIFK
jgi:2-polyprenyl-3-methyl-5-hydroxy-6-metoxy-1,4-benzoquinol methylase